MGPKIHQRVSNGSLGFFDEGLGPLDLALGVTELDGLAVKGGGLPTVADTVAETTGMGDAAEAACPELPAELSGASLESSAEVAGTVLAASSTPARAGGGTVGTREKARIPTPIPIAAITSSSSSVQTQPERGRETVFIRCGAETALTLERCSARAASASSVRMPPGAVTPRTGAKAATRLSARAKRFFGSVAVAFSNHASNAAGRAAP
jgi:hypothetical protein